MSLLAPLYFLGALAVSLPILFHLIRRQPKGQVEFSSLMFLQPTPPRLTRRSRLDNWPLLLLRALVLMLLAAAFARPFLRSVALSDSELPGRRMVLVVDTSASMQRAGLWQQALDRADEVLADFQPADRLAVVTFDRSPKTLLGFDQSSQLTPEQLKTTARKLLRDTGPTWQPTEMGTAVSFAGDLAVTYEPEDETKPSLLGDDDAPSGGGSSGPAHMILITDLQEGSQIENLQVYAWPKELRLDVRKVAPKDRTNASALLLAQTPDSAQESDRVRVRVSNSADATDSRFRIRWTADGSEATNSSLTELPVQVPPGQSRVVRMPTPPPGVTALQLQGDDHSFDNQRYVVSPEPVAMSLLHVGDAAAEPRDSLFYYLQRVPLSDQQRVVSIDSISADKLDQIPDPKEVPLIVLGSAASDDVSKRLRDYVADGGRLLAVLSDARQSAAITATINEITSGQLRVTEAEIDDYVMFSKIDFDHFVFQPMADPKFNDFTKIRFWSHRSIEVTDEAWNLVARFDDGDPAIIQRPLGDGHLLVLAAGWQPQESQLALSTKFIPLIFSLFDFGGGKVGSDQYTVGQAIAMQPSDTATITGPAGSAFAYRSVEDLDGIDQPGIYKFRDGDEVRTFAVNLVESESRTEALDEEEFERFGVVLGKNVTAEQALETQRQLRDQELESQQKLWQWLLATALVLLALETCLGAIWSRRRVDESTEPATV